MLRIKIRLLFFIGIVLIPAAFIFSQNIFLPEINKEAEKYVSQKNNKGIVIGIINGDETAVQGFGVKSDLEKERPDENTIFEVGSITNVFTTSLMLLESYQGKFSLGERVQSHAPPGVQIPTYQHMVCTEYFIPDIMDSDAYRIVSCQPDPTVPDICIGFCDLASHSSGLPSEPKGIFRNKFFRKIFYKKDPYKNYTKRDLYNDLPKYTINCPPGVHFDYSNVGMALLGNIMADMNNISYGDLLQNAILSPLEMENTGVGLSRTQLQFLAKGHNKKGKAVKHWSFKGMAPAGGVKSSAGDLVKFLQVNMGLAGKQIIMDAFAQTHEPQLDHPSYVLNKKTYTGYGWFTSELNPTTKAVWVSGSTGGFRSFIGFVKSSNVGIVVLSNSAEDVEAMGFEMLELLNEEAGKEEPVLLGGGGK
ncbi:MAG: serine hydrolase domain-containing protein [Bacteroidota bacterium]